MMLLTFCVILTATYVAEALVPLLNEDIAPLPNKEDLAPLPNICYTQWFDRDNPSGVGDYETLVHLRAEYPQKICNKPQTIQAATLTGVPAESIGQVFQAYDRYTGFVCVNSEQNNGCCLDYKVRFGCLCPWPQSLIQP